MEISRFAENAVGKHCPVNFPIVLNSFRSKCQNRYSSVIEDRDGKWVSKLKFDNFSLPKIKDSRFHDTSKLSVHSPSPKVQFEVVGQKKGTSFKATQHKSKKARTNRFSTRLVKEVSLSVDFDDDFPDPYL